MDAHQAPEFTGFVLGDRTKPPSPARPYHIEQQQVHRDVLRVVEAVARDLLAGLELHKALVALLLDGLELRWVLGLDVGPLPFGRSIVGQLFGDRQSRGDVEIVHEPAHARRKNSEKRTQRVVWEERAHRE